MLRRFGRARYDGGWTAMQKQRFFALMRAAVRESLPLPNDLLMVYIDLYSSSLSD
jgi:hypothetical protein